MVGKTDYSSVPTSVDLENNSKQKKYTVNQRPNGLHISKPLCTLMAIGAVLLAVLVGLLVFFFVPRCSEASPEAYTKNQNSDSDTSDDVTFPKSPTTKSQLRESDERLPKSIEPSHYLIRIMPYLNNLTTHGSITMTLNAKEGTSEIIFHAKDIAIDKGSVKFRSKDETLGVVDQAYIEGERYRIVVDKKLSPGAEYWLDLMYTGHLSSHLQGFYRSQYEQRNQDNTVSEKFLASTQFSPTDARRAFPCFDEPSLKANFSIVIAKLSNFSTLSNMPLERSEPDPNNAGLIWDHYKTTPKMSTYLVAFILSDLQGYGSSDKQITLWSRRDLLYQTRYAAELAPKLLRFFENLFDLKFPLPKIDIVAIPDFGYNAMENWGLITFRESTLLYDDQESDFDNKRDIATVLAHEIAHQWFGNLVTPKWWNDLWLKEGFATYLQYLGTDFAEPSWRIEEEFIISEIDRAFALDALPSSRAISFDVKNGRQIRQTFDELSYGKGACVVRMMSHFLGETAFKTGLKKFLQKYQYSNANGADLFKVLAEEARLDPSINLEEVMDSWTKQAGFPVITAIANRANGKVVLAQERFFFTDKGSDNSTWWVPISVVTDLNPSFGNSSPTLWLKEHTMTTYVNMTEWYLINVNHTGYYLVNYDENNWRRLIEQIMALPPLTRAQLISNSMDLARANLLDYDIPLRLIARMAIRDQDIMFIPTSIAFKKLEYLSDMLASTPVFGLFEEFHSTIFKRTYRNVVGADNYYVDHYLSQKIRKAVLKWSCRSGDSECSIKFHHMFRAWMEKNERVPANIRDVVYCTAVRQGGKAEWEFAYWQFLNARSVSEKNVLLDALGCTTKKWLLSRFLDNLAYNKSSVKIQDAARVFKSVSDNNIASTMVFDFLRLNWDKLLAHYGEGFNIISKMVKSLPRYMNTEYQLLELIRFKNEVKNNIGTANLALDSAIETVRGNVAWMKKNYHSVEKWLITHQQHYNML